jgi:ribosome-associated protein
VQEEQTPPADETPHPSRSQQRRDALATLELAGRLVALPPARVAGLDLPEDVRDEVRAVQRTGAHGARKRELGYLAKLMRAHGEEVKAAAHAALGDDPAARRRESAAQERLAVLRERLLEEGDAVIGELADQYPQLDRQRLRSLVRQAHDEARRGKPAHASRKLLAFLHEL